MILVIDNYDSFVFNVARYFEELGRDVLVLRNDAIDILGVRQLAPAAIVISPGPGTPRDAGISQAIVHELNGAIPILGVCLGHQCIGAEFGAPVVPARRPLHGRTSKLSHVGARLFEGLPQKLVVGRYHSLIVAPTEAMETALSIDAVSEEGEIMALSHRFAPTYGVQFHPESILTEKGHAIFGNFLKLAGLAKDGAGENLTQGVGLDVTASGEDRRLPSLSE
ncbi:aminodeoxychorismate/anthranilate synthase component II [Methylovirgula sp. HY1]|uniref:anthranilate synthase component II n=1 Tax=Methylovirgula sp. HY1 TaxID=2822761 RepID=UPI001C5B0E0A|nr:aminodeoxychorismate/anthranilate synthase component II [Methylovirgula sp. HY1]